jgi:hypothetical protein
MICYLLEVAFLAPWVGFKSQRDVTDATSPSVHDLYSTGVRIAVAFTKASGLRCPSEQYLVHSPAISTMSPSSRSASPISVSLSILSPSTTTRAAASFSAGTFKFAAFTNARTISPHVVVGRTAIVRSLAAPDRMTSLNFSAFSCAGGSSSSGNEDGPEGGGEECVSAGS